MAETVTVACKLPNGLILRVFEMQDWIEPAPGGASRPTKRAIEVGERVEIKGNAAPQGMSPSAPVFGGFALTHNVDAELWKKWIAQNKESDIVKQNLIFAVEKPMMVQAMAKERHELRSGMERINPKGDIRMPKRQIKQFDPKDDGSVAA